MVGEFFTWLFSTRQGVMALIGSGLVIFLIIAFILERRGRKYYYDHGPEEGDDDSVLGAIFADDEDADA